MTAFLRRGNPIILSKDHDGHVASVGRCDEALQ